MMEIGALALTSPWMLLGLLSLPVIWWLLRITPPAPRRERFPPIRLILELAKTEETPAATPLWLTILRLLLAAIIVVALAHPIINPMRGLHGAGPLFIVVDDGWAAAANWQKRLDALNGLASRAEREERSVVLLRTAPPPDGAPVAMSEVMRASALRDIVRAMEPRPWPVDRTAAAAALDTIQPSAPPQVIWLSDGIDDGGAIAFSDHLGRFGSGSLITDDPDTLAKALLPPDFAGAGLTIPVLRPTQKAPQSVWIRAMAEGSRVLARAQATFAAGQKRIEVPLNLPTEIRNDVARIDIEGAVSAGATLLLDERWRRRPVGLVSGADLETRSQPLLSNLYYLERALTPYADVSTGSIADLLQQPLALIALADVGQLAPTDRTQLDEWLRQGGTVVRFAGPLLAQNVDTLIPVRLRGGGRTLGGALTWSKPARLAPFSTDSPFHGLDIPDDVLVHRQVLAEPSLELNESTWARLSDGTPLVTTQRRDKGTLVLFHVTANTEWSNLPISGLFVAMMRRLLARSHGVSAEAGEAPLPPLANLDGFGRLGPAVGTAQPISGDVFDATIAGPKYPPGYYGTEENRRALNLTAGMRELAPISVVPDGFVKTSLSGERERDLKPWLLATALMLGLVDVFAALALRGLLPIRLYTRQAGAFLIAMTLSGTVLTTAKPASAQDADAFALKATLETRLAYVLTGDSELDSLSQAGLFGLSEILRQRTSIEPAAPLGVDIERDELMFFPLIYWPMRADMPPLSEQAVVHIGQYMRTGGTFLFDTRDAQTAVPGFGGRLAASGSAERLKRLLRRLDIPPLTPVPQDHVLTKAFYLMQDFPGRYVGSRLWVEQRSGGVNDGVSGVVIGGNDWAAAWARDEAGRPMAAVVPGGARQRELAYRFGVNLVMYTLTGNYKADQVHVPAILERLGQ